jgi:group I intron endonuclease
MIGIYKITSPTGKVYIGQAVDITGRKKKYSRLSCKKQPRLYNSLLKYGFSEHIFEVVEECEVEELNTRERYWQDFYNVLGNRGLNCKLTETENISGHLSEETKRKIGQSNKGKQRTLQVREKLSRIKKGNIPWNKGIKMTEECKDKISKSKKGKPSKKKGSKLSEDIKKVMNQSRIKYKNIVKFNKKGMQVYSTIKEAVAEGYNREQIRLCLTGKAKTHKGFFWKMFDK